MVEEEIMRFTPNENISTVDQNGQEQEQEEVMSIDKSTNEEVKKQAEETAKANERAKFKTTNIVLNNLPSAFKPYPEGVVVSYDTYAIQEIKDLSEANLPVWQQYEIMLDGMHTEKMSNRDITLFDAMYISVLRKLSAIPDPKFKLVYYCPKEEVVSSDTFHFNDHVGFNQLEVDKLPINAELEVGKMSFSPLTVGDFIFLHKNDLFYRKRDDEYLTDTNGNLLKDFVAIMAAQCVSHSFEEAYELLNKVTSQDDIDIIERIDQMLNHGIAPITFKCQNRMGEKTEENYEEDDGTGVPEQLRDKRPVCGQEITVSLLGGEAIVVPFREHEQSIESRISFG